MRQSSWLRMKYAARKNATTRLPTSSLYRERKQKYKFRLQFESNVFGKWQIPEASLERRKRSEERYFSMRITPQLG